MKYRRNKKRGVAALVIKMKNSVHEGKQISKYLL
jgi:hypothetical protein